MDSRPSLLISLSEGQIEQNFVICKYVTNCLHNHNETVDVIKSFYVFRVKVQLFTNFSIFIGIKLKFGGGVNSVTLVAYFISVLPHKMNLIK